MPPTNGGRKERSHTARCNPAGSAVAPLRAGA